MKYSFVLAGLAASAIATPYVDIVVGEDSVTTARHHHTHHEHNHHHGGWFSSLLGRSHFDRGNRRGHQNGHRRHHFMGLGDDDGMVGEHYECILTARHNRDERENTKRCCNQQGGELYESRGHCIFRNTMGDPQEEWQACGMMAHGTDFAACYPRAPREIDDELAGRGWHNDEEEHRRNHGRHGRSHSHGRHNRNHHGGRMTVFDGDDGNNHGNDGNHGNHGRKHHKKQEIFECRIDMDDDSRRQQLLQQCCEEDVGGHLDIDSQTCWNVRKNDRAEFENCAMAQGAQNAECYRPNDDENGGDGDNDGDNDRDLDRY